MNGFARDLVPSWHTSLLQQDIVPVQLQLPIAPILVEIFCIPAVRFIHNMIGYIQWRPGTLAYNLVTSTSGLNELRAKEM